MRSGDRRRKDSSTHFGGFSPPGHYPYLLDVASYPDYSRRAVRVPTWETFEDRPQFITLREFAREEAPASGGSEGMPSADGAGGTRLTGSLTRLAETLDTYTRRYGLGRIIWPNIAMIYAPNFPELVKEVRQRGLWMFDVWGYVPGNGFNTCWAQYVVPPGISQLLREELGDRFLSCDNGEQDGRYVGRYAGQQCPAPARRFDAYLNFQRHFERLCGDLGNRMSALVSLCFGHYFLKEGNHLLLGAETAQALPNSQVYYAFIRGAGKQYGVHWFGNASCYNRWGYKHYDGDGGDSRGMDTPGPQNGASLNLLKRLLYTHYFYNCVAMGFELSYLTERRQYAVDGFDNWNRPDEPPYLSPIGAIQAALARFVEKAGHPGVMHAPVALLLDHFSGWTMPRHLYSPHTYQVWGALPYDEGDFLTHGLLSLCYPGYEDSGFCHDEKGHLADTPYGDMTDCLLTDAPGWVLGQYTTVIAAGRLAIDDELREKLTAFVRDGGHFVVTAANARELWPELAIGEPINCRKGTSIRLADGRCLREPHAFSLCPCKLPPRAAVVNARAGRLPAAFVWKLGRGNVTVLLSSFGQNDRLLTPNEVTSEIDTPLPAPFRLLEHVSALVGDALAAERLFSVGANLGYVTCRRRRGLYWLLLHNNGFTAQPFRIESLCGTLRSVREVSLDAPEKRCVGYWPIGFEKADGGVSNDTLIAGGDVRLFEICVTEKNVRILKRVTPPAPPRGRYLTLPLGGAGIKEAVLQFPAFFQHFDGAKIDWTWLRDRDTESLRADRPWLDQQKLSVLVDFTSGCNHYPDISFLDLNRDRWHESRARLTGVLDRMALLGSRAAVFCLHGLSEEENYLMLDATEPRYRANVAELCAYAAERGITLYLQSHPNKRHPRSADMLKFIATVGAQNLKYALNTAHTLLAGETLDGALKKAADRMAMVLLSAPERDLFGRGYDAHRPVAGAALCLQSLKALGTTVVFDARYSSWSEIYRDVKTWKQCVER